MNSVEQNDSGSGSKNQTEKLMALTLDIVPFRAEDGAAYAKFNIDGHLEVWPIHSQTIKDLVQDRFYQKYLSLPLEKNLDRVASHLLYQAKKNPKTEKVFQRLGEANSKVYLDLGCPHFRVIEISSGEWCVVDGAPINFIRNKNTMATPFPCKDGNINELKKFINLESENDFILLLAFVIGSMSPSREYPILILQGTQGSSKSTVSSMLKSLIDPGYPTLRSFPKREEDLFIAAQNSHLICFDNLSGISNVASDSLCKIATGCGLATRKLYTNTEESCIELSRPIVINGIDDLASRSDLADRSIVLHLPKIPEEMRKTSTEFWSEFELRKGAIFGCLLSALAYGLERKKSLKLDKKPRMAEFAQTICAALEYFDISAEQSLEALLKNRVDIAMDSIEANSVSRAMRSFVTGSSFWRGSATALLEVLNQRISDEERRGQHWPKSPQSLMRELNRMGPALRLDGIEINCNRQGRRREVIISKFENIPSQASLSSLHMFGALKVTQVTQLALPVEERSHDAQ